jgi:hypothetical protein
MKKTKELSGSTAENHMLSKLVEDLQKNNEVLINAHKESQLRSLKQLIVAKRLLGVRTEMNEALIGELGLVSHKLLDLLLKASTGRLSNENLIEDLNKISDSIGKEYRSIDWESKIDAVDKFSKNIMEDIEKETV